MKLFTSTHWASFGMGIVLCIAVAGCGDNGGDGSRQTSDAIEFRCLGSAGTTDPPVIFNSGGTFELSPPYELDEATDGVSVTVFPPPTTFLPDLTVQVNFASRGHSTECTTGTSPGGGGFGERIPVRITGRDGIAIAFSRADLVAIANFLNTFPPLNGACSDVRADDLSIYSLNVADVALENVLVDAIAIGSEWTIFPTPDTMLPTCLITGEEG